MISKRLTPLFNNWLLASWIIVGLFAVPLLVVFSSVFQFDWQVWQHLANTVLSDYVINSLLLAFFVGLGTGVIGTYLAWFMVNYDFIGRSVLNWLILLPLAMPAYIIAYTYTGLFDFSSPLQDLLRSFFDQAPSTRMLPDLRNLSGAIGMMILVLYPYVYLLARNAFNEQSSQFELAGQLAGLNKRQYLQKVALPLARPAILTGVALAMMEALSDFGTVAYFGVSTFTTGIYRTWFGMGNALAASQLASLLCLFVFIFLWLEKASRKNQSRFQSRHASQRQLKKVSKAKSIGIFTLCLLPAMFGFVLPFMQLLWWSVAYFEDQQLAGYLPLLTSSLQLAGLSALLIVGIALLLSYTKRKYFSKKLQVATQFISLGYALPGIVIAVGVVQVAGFTDIKLNQLFVAIADYQPGLIISGGFAILLFAYSIRYLSVALHNTDTGLERIKPNVDEVAQTLGASSSRILRQIHMPMLSASIVSAAILVFVDVLKELPATLILRPFNVNTLAVRAYELASDERLIDAALPAVSIVLAGIIPVILLTLNLNKQKH